MFELIAAVELLSAGAYETLLIDERLMKSPISKSPTTATIAFHPNFNCMSSFAKILFIMRRSIIARYLNWQENGDMTTAENYR